MSAGPMGPGSVPRPKVFITYRREETAAHAGRLYDAMVARFGEGNVFMDVDMAPGVDFVERITEAVAACNVLIVVMGPRWATVEDEQGRARIADPEDFVRLEVKTALRRPDVTPIPVLVSGARMPHREDLPEEVRAITRRNALELSDQRWRYDVGRLVSTLDELLTDVPLLASRSFREPSVATGKAAQTDAAQASAQALHPAVSIMSILSFVVTFLLLRILVNSLYDEYSDAHIGWVETVVMMLIVAISLACVWAVEQAYKRTPPATGRGGAAHTARARILTFVVTFLLLVVLVTDRTSYVDWYVVPIAAIALGCAWAAGQAYDRMRRA